MDTTKRRMEVLARARATLKEREEAQEAAEIEEIGRVHIGMQKALATFEELYAPSRPGGPTGIGRSMTCTLDLVERFQPLIAAMFQEYMRGMDKAKREGGHK